MILVLIEYLITDQLRNLGAHFPSGILAIINCLRTPSFPAAIPTIDPCAFLQRFHNEHWHPRINAAWDASDGDSPRCYQPPSTLAGQKSFLRQQTAPTGLSVDPLSLRDVWVLSGRDWGTQQPLEVKCLQPHCLLHLWNHWTAEGWYVSPVAR